MIITKLRVEEEHPMASSTTSWPQPLLDLNLDLTAGENGYVLKSAAGLGPPSLVAVVEGFDITGIPVMNNVPEKRQIVLKIGLSPQLGQSYGSLRDFLYKLIDRTVFVKFMNESEIVGQTTGFIRNVDPVHFSNKPEIELTIECVEGDLASPFVVNIPIGTLNTLNPVIVYEDGTAPTGLDLVINVTANHSGFLISNHSKFWHSGSADVVNQFQVTYAFLTGDQIFISTHPRNKRILLVRAGVQYDLAGYINAGAVWPKLYSGVNSFTWTFAASWMTFTSASYYPRYWGV